MKESFAAPLFRVIRNGELKRRETINNYHNIMTLIVGVPFSERPLIHERGSLCAITSETRMGHTP